MKQVTMMMSLVIISALMAIPVNMAAEEVELESLEQAIRFDGQLQNSVLSFINPGLGDFNGDGLDDIALISDLPTDEEVKVYVVFNPGDGPWASLDEIENQQAGGVVISLPAWDYETTVIMDYGDINGDGKADIIISDPDPEYSGWANGYVIFGRSGTTPIYAIALLGSPSQGFVIQASDNQEIISIATGADLDGDQRDDIVMAIDDEGESNLYVFYGKGNTGILDVNIFDDGENTFGYMIEGEGLISSNPWISFIGDYNGDGTDDYAIGQFFNDTMDIKEMYVVLGQRSSQSVTLKGLIDRGQAFSISHDSELEVVGSICSGVGDVNQDGYDDILFGAFSASDFLSVTGNAIVLFGQSSPQSVYASEIEGTGKGVRLQGIQPRDVFGQAPTGPGDANGDGLADLLIGSSGADNFTGKALLQTDISNGTDGIWYSGTEGSQAGASVGFAGDINRDSLSDVIISAPTTGLINYQGGRTYLIPSTEPLPPLATWKSYLPRNSIPPRGVGYTGISSKRPGLSGVAIGFTRGSGPTNGPSLQTVTVYRHQDDLSGLRETLPVYWKVETDRTGWTNARLIFQYPQWAVDHIDESKVAIYQASSKEGPWVPLADQSLDQTRNQVRCNTTELGYFALSVVERQDPILLNPIGYTKPGLVLKGEAADDNAGFSISMAGDVNGDGLADMVVGAPGSIGGNFESGRAYVVFGQKAQEAINLADIESADKGFVIDGEGFLTQAGDSVSAAGDVNGDGLGDLIIGASQAAANGTNSGRVYLVFGKKNTETVSLLNIVNSNSGGVHFDGESSNQYAGAAVSVAGDVNGDGYSDILIGAPEASPTATRSGRCYVVFGRKEMASMNLSSLESAGAGFYINGAARDDYAGDSVATAGDVNGDSLADMIIGAPQADVPGTDAGRVWVVFGRESTTAVNLADVTDGEGGFVVYSEQAESTAGYAVSPAGDVNGDGLADIAIGAPEYEESPDSLGRVYLVFGKQDTRPVDLADIVAGQGGYSITGTENRGDFGGALGAAGDINADGLSDIIVGASNTDGASYRSGISYVIFGKTNTLPILLESVNGGLNGFAMLGDQPSDHSGWSVSGGGDINGDGLDDVLVGAVDASPNGTGSGIVYAVFNPWSPERVVPDGLPETATYASIMTAGDTTMRGIGLYGTGDDVFGTARTKLDFVLGDLPSQQIVTLFHNTEIVGRTPPGKVALTAWNIETDRTVHGLAQVQLKYTEAEVAFTTESTLKLFRSPVLSGPWKEISTATVDTEKNVVEFETTNVRGWYLLVGNNADTIEIIGHLLGMIPAEEEFDYTQDGVVDSSDLIESQK